MPINIANNSTIGHELNIANKRYDDRDFINDLNELLSDIPHEAIDDADDLFSAVVTGMETNFPRMFDYFKINKNRLHKIILGAFSSWDKKHNKNFANSGDYLEYFRDKLKEWGVTSPSDLSDKDKSDFFTEVKQGK